MAWEFLGSADLNYSNGIIVKSRVVKCYKNGVDKVYLYVEHYSSPTVINNYSASNISVTESLDFNKYEYRVVLTEPSGTSVIARVTETETENFSDFIFPKSSKVNFVVKAELQRQSKNATPNINLSAPTDASTLYENSTLPIVGNATDADNGNIVNVRYSINDGTARALATGISDGNTAIPFAKTLTFKNGKLFDGDMAITDTLAEGTAHMLRVWATDDQGATSTIISRSFYAVPNRAPVLTVDTPQPTGSINSDKFAITGTCSDIDGNEVTVAYRINGANPVQIYKGQGGAWSFDVSLSALQVGANSIVIEVTDSYNFKATKTVRLNKNEIKTPVNTATARYKLTPPKGSATGVLVWVRRTETLQLDAKISMTLKGEQEQYFAPTDEITTEQVAQGIVEDEFIFSTAEAKTDIVLKLEMTKTQENDAITLVTGVFN